MPVGIIITISTLAVILPMMLIMRRVFGGLSRQNAETQRLLQVGIPASARILGTRMGGMTMTVNAHRHLQLVIQLQVHPTGRPPYQTQLTTLVSELQVPQLQPGAMVQVRIDPANPNKLALEAVGMPGAAPGMAAPGMAGHAAPQAAVPRMQYGAAPRQQYGASPGAAPGMIPVQPVTMPAGAKVGMVMGILGALVAVGVSVFVSMGVGSTSSSTTTPGVTVPAAEAATSSEVCTKAVRCCEVVSGANAANSCGNLSQPGVPDHACQSSLDGFVRAAEAMGKTCG